MLSSEYGTAARKKQEFFSDLFASKPRQAPEFRRDEFNAIVTRGRSVLSVADAMVN